MMGNNSTNSNKTNSHLSSQFAGYKNMPRDMTLEIKTLAWDRHINMVGENRLMGLQLLSIIASPSAINTYTSDENLHYIYIYSPTKVKHHLTCFNNIFSNNELISNRFAVFVTYTHILTYL